jgi:tetratricopeptide (TPR) repeat protein
MNRHPFRLKQTRWFAPFAAAAALALCGSARADDSAAADHAKRGRVAYDLQDWPLAIQEYRAAYAAEQKPEYLFGLAQAQRQKGEYAAAIVSFRAYKRIDAVAPQQATAAELLITKCEAEQSKEEAAAAARKNAQAPTTVPASPPPSTAPALSPHAASPVDDRPSGSKAFYEDALGDALFVAGIGAAGAGAFFLFSGNSDMKNSSSKPTQGAAQSAADSAHGKQVVGAIVLPAGGVLLAGAIWRWVSAGQSERQTNTGWMIGPSFVGYSGRF